MAKVLVYSSLIPLWVFIATSSLFAQVRTVKGPVECFSETAASAYKEAEHYSSKGEHEKALIAFQRSVRAEPTCAGGYNNLGTAYFTLGRHLEAIDAYQQALSFKPSWGWICYFNIGRSYGALDRIDEALKAYDETIRLQPKDESAYRARARLYLRLGKGEAVVSDTQMFLKLKGWRDKNSIYVVIWEYLGYRQIHQDEAARRVFDEAVSKVKKNDWPFPVVRYLRRDISEQELLASATELDKQIEARTYLGMHLCLSNRVEEARTHLNWVMENAKKSSAYYKLALSELERIEKKVSRAIH